MSYLKTVFILHTFKENVNPFDLSVLYDYNRKKQKGYDDMEPYTDNDMTEDVSENDDSDIRRYLHSATAILILINVIIFLKTDISSMIGGEDVWIDKGCLSWYHFFYRYEYYRVLTCMFLHGGIDHIFNNMLCLFFMGSFLEQHIGTPRFLILYFSSGIIAGFTSMVYNMLLGINTLSIGASGAIFGITGGLLALVLFHRKEIEIDYRQMIFAAFLSLYSGLTDQGVDNAAHLGGFLGGLLLGLLVGIRKQRQQTKDSFGSGSLWK